VTRAGRNPGMTEARRIFERTLEAIDVRSTLARKVARNGSFISCGDSEIDLRAFREIVVIAIGKAALPMAEGFVNVIAPDLHSEGIAAAPEAWPSPLSGWRSYIGGHPLPNEQSLAAGRAILERLSRCGPESLVIFLLSGGGSALAELPLDSGLTLADLRALHAALVSCGAPIEAINAIRKHLSAVKGGRLAAAAPRSTRLTYAISDVPAGHESALASGPTLPDPTTVDDVLRVVREYGLRERLPASLGSIFERQSLVETPKPGDALFTECQFDLLLGMHDLFHQAHIAAEAEGYVAVCDNSADGLPLGTAADSLLQQLETLRRDTPERRVAVIADGEVSSPVTGNGIGGRNSAFVLVCAEKIAGESITVLSAGTDGVDGNSPAAGAVADGRTLGRALDNGMDPRDFLKRSDAWNFFCRLGDTLETGPTGINLRDLRILLGE
jgi:glycerate 2-kinase